VSLEIERGTNAVQEDAGQGDFEGRLRKLESLRRDGLISEAEYARKRAEILGERW
jgi:hypothetical protein